MFNWIKNQFLAKMQVEKFISSQYVNFINEVIKLLHSDMNKQDIIIECRKIRDEIIDKYNLGSKDNNNVC